MVVLSVHFTKKRHLFECRAVITLGAVNRTTYSILFFLIHTSLKCPLLIPSRLIKKTGISLPQKLGTKMLTWRLSVHLPMYTTSILQQFRILLVEWAWYTSFTRANKMYSLTQTSYIHVTTVVSTKRTNSVPQYLLLPHKHTHTHNYRHQTYLSLFI
jgi:hypothetical protein